MFLLIPQTKVSYLFKVCVQDLNGAVINAELTRPALTSSMRKRGAVRCVQVVSDLQSNGCNKLLIPKAGQLHLSSYQQYEVEKCEQDMAAVFSLPRELCKTTAIKNWSRKI